MNTLHEKTLETLKAMQGLILQARRDHEWELANEIELAMFNITKALDNTVSGQIAIIKNCPNFFPKIQEIKRNECDKN